MNLINILKNKKYNQRILKIQEDNQKMMDSLNKFLNAEGYAVDTQVVEILSTNRLLTCYTHQEILEILKYFEVIPSNNHGEE